MPVTSVVVFDWYATLASPNADDFWERIPELIVAAGGAVDPAAPRSWEAEHPLTWSRPEPGCRPRRSFVGDNWLDDIEGASAAGLRAIHVSTGTPCADRDHGSVPCLDRLADLPALL